MKIAVFGGAFDPIHLGHENVITSLLTASLVDEVWLMPAGQHPFDKNMSSAAHRLAMLQLVLDQHHIAHRLKIDTTELDSNQPSYSFNTLEKLKSQYPQHNFKWVMGTDNLAAFSKWFNHAKLLEQYGVLVYPRAGYDPEPLLPGMRALLDMEQVQVSSTQIREDLGRHGIQAQQWQECVSPAVAQYILNQALYVG